MYTHTVFCVHNVTIAVDSMGLNKTINSPPSFVVGVNFKSVIDLSKPKSTSRTRSPISLAKLSSACCIVLVMVSTGEVVNDDGCYFVAKL